MQESMALALTFNSLVWAGCSLWVFFWRKAPVYHPVFFVLAYHFIGFVIRPILILLQNGSDVWLRTGVTPDNNTLIYTSIVSSFALLAMVFGISIASKRRVVFDKLDTISLVISHPKRYFLCIALFCCLGIWGLITGYGGAGLDSVQAFEVQYDAAGGQRLVGVSGYVLALGEFLPVICILLFMDKRRRAFAIAVIAVYVAIRFYIGAQRLSFVVVLIGAYLIHLVNTGKRYPKLKLVAYVMLFALVFDVIGGDRFAFRRLVAGEETVTGVITNYLDKRSKNILVNDLAEYDVASSALQVVPQKSGWSYGSQYLRILIWPIPRQLWPEKPVYTSLIDLNKYGYFLAMTHTLYVDAYMVLGIIPMIFILAALGYYVGRLYERAKHTENIMWFMAFWMQLIYMKTLLRDGGVTSFYFLFISLFCVFIIKRAGGLRLIRNA